MYQYDLTRRCKRLPDEVYLPDEMQIKKETPWNGRTYGVCIGKLYTDGRVKSLFTNDYENGDVKLFERCLHMDVDENILFAMSGSEITNTGEIDEFIAYYVLYDAKEHVAQKPTAVHPANGEAQKYTYEITLGAGRHTGYFTLDMDRNIFGEKLSSVLHERIFEDSTDFRVELYDEVGGSIIVQFKTAKELCNLITSTRLIAAE